LSRAKDISGFLAYREPNHQYSIRTRRTIRRTTRIRIPIMRTIRRIIRRIRRR
jgi:hypothetical protein